MPGRYGEEPAPKLLQKLGTRELSGGSPSLRLTFPYPTFDGSFRVVDIQGQCPGVNLDMIRKVLKDVGPQVKCLGRGKSAKWEKTAKWKLGKN